MCSEKVGDSQENCPGVQNQSKRNVIYTRIGFWMPGHFSCPTFFRWISIWSKVDRFYVETSNTRVHPHLGHLTWITVAHHGIELRFSWLISDVQCNAVVGTCRSSPCSETILVVPVLKFVFTCFGLTGLPEYHPLKVSFLCDAAPLQGCILRFLFGTYYLDSLQLWSRFSSRLFITFLSFLLTPFWWEIFGSSNRTESLRLQVLLFVTLSKNTDR